MMEYFISAIMVILGLAEVRASDFSDSDGFSGTSNAALMAVLGVVLAAIMFVALTQGYNNGVNIRGNSCCSCCADSKMETSVTPCSKNGSDVPYEHFSNAEAACSNERREGQAHVSGFGAPPSDGRAPTNGDGTITIAPIVPPNPARLIAPPAPPRTAQPPGNDGPQRANFMASSHGFEAPLRVDLPSIGNREGPIGSTFTLDEECHVYESVETPSEISPDVGAARSYTSGELVASAEPVPSPTAAIPNHHRPATYPVIAASQHPSSCSLFASMSSTGTRPTTNTGPTTSTEPTTNTGSTISDTSVSFAAQWPAATPLCSSQESPVAASDPSHGSLAHHMLSANQDTGILRSEYFTSAASSLSLDLTSDDPTTMVHFRTAQGLSSPSTSDVPPPGYAVEWGPVYVRRTAPAMGVVPPITTSAPAHQSVPIGMVMQASEQPSSADTQELIYTHPEQETYHS